ncbi:MAG: class I SAM-dependent methyltransferase [Desulfamplus sp.]|nr:class I SAM-dependent methyltransferase [Desulfamplus sp.]
MNENLIIQKAKIFIKGLLLRRFPKLIQMQWEKRGGENWVQELSPAYQQMYEGLTRIILQDKPQTILEYGCGYGYLLKILFENSENAQKRKFWGCDYSSSQVRQAKHYFPQANFIQADITKKAPEFENIQFDAVVGVSVLMYLSQRGIIDFLQEVKKICRGKIYIVEYYYKYLSNEKQKAYQEAMPNDGRKIYDYEQLLKENGITVIETQQFESMINPETNSANEMPLSLTIGQL